MFEKIEEAFASREVSRLPAPPNSTWGLVHCDDYSVEDGEKEACEF